MPAADVALWKRDATGAQGWHAKASAGSRAELCAEAGALRLDFTLAGHGAWAIARREIEAGEEPAQAELARLCSLFGEPAREVHGPELEYALADCNRRLARAIRAGRYDEARAALLAHLRRSVEEKLAISNPKALPGK